MENARQMQGQQENVLKSKKSLEQTGTILKHAGKYMKNTECMTKAGERQDKCKKHAGKAS